MTTIILLSVASVLAVLITLSRVIGLRRIVQHSTKVDVSFTLIAAGLLAGTLTGIATAIVAGLLMALVLTALKWVYAAKDATQRGIARVKADRTEYNDKGWIYNQEPYL